MSGFLKAIFSSDFMPHGYCYLWKPELVWLHAVSDGIIALSYYLIPIALVVFARQRRDLPFNWMFLLFGLFIFGCGTTHLMEVWTLWHGTYWLAGVLKAFTAMVSLATAVLLIPLVPVASALPSPEQLRVANAELEKEIAEHRRAEEELQAIRSDLEVRVRDRTADLASVNEELHATCERGDRQDPLAHEEELRGSTDAARGQRGDSRSAEAHGASDSSQRDRAADRPRCRHSPPYSATACNCSRCC